MALDKWKKIISADADDGDEDEKGNVERKVSSSENGKMILLEPRAYSESQQIADHLKMKNTVVVNMRGQLPMMKKRERRIRMMQIWIGSFRLEGEL